ncbi:MAG: adenosine deaminase family protein, partial [Acidimicrobiales bacterium]
MAEDGTAMTDRAAFIAGMPKAELHMHIEGALEPAQKFEMAARNGAGLDGSAADVEASYDFDDLSTFLEARYDGDKVLVTELDFYQLAIGYFERVAAENLVYAEIFFDPQAHTSRGVAFSTVIEGIRRAQVEATDRLGIDSELIMCFLRDHSVESAAEALHQAEPYRQWIVGVGLDSDEHRNPPVKFAEIYRAAADQGYRLTAHCDVDQE